MTEDVGTEVRAPGGVRAARSAIRPIVLATLGVPFDGSAEVFAVDAAVESGALLVVVNVTSLEPLRMSLVFGYDSLEEFTPEVSASTRRPAELARSLGVQVERIKVRTPRPLQALLELTAERRAGLLVFGPDRTRLRERAYRRAVRRVREASPCLVWTADPA
ncbi:MAG: universal stress protein [Actinomycetota bacterium]